MTDIEMFIIDGIVSRGKIAVCFPSAHHLESWLEEWGQKLLSAGGVLHKRDRIEYPNGAYIQLIVIHGNSIDRLRGTEWWTIITPFDIDSESYWDALQYLIRRPQ